MMNHGHKGGSMRACRVRRWRWRCWRLASVGVLRKVGRAPGDEKPSRPPTRPTSTGLQEGGRASTRRRSRADPQPCSGATSTWEQLRQSVQAEQEGRSRQRRAAEQGGRELPDGRRQAVGLAEPEDKKLGEAARSNTCVAAYGADKLNDPAKAEPVVQQMIQLEPSEPTNYFVLAKIYEDAGAYDEAEQMLITGEGGQAERSGRLHELAGYYNRQGQFDKTIDALAGARGQGAEQPRGVLHHRDLLLGQGAPRLHPEGQ